MRLIYFSPAMVPGVARDKITPPLRSMDAGFSAGSMPMMGRCGYSALRAAAAALVGMTCQLEDATLGTLTVTMKAGGTAMVSDGYRSATTALIPLDVSAAPAIDPGTGAVAPFRAELHVFLPARTKAPKKAAAFRRMRIAWNGAEWLPAEGD